MNIQASGLLCVAVLVMAAFAGCTTTRSYSIDERFIGEWAGDYFTPITTITVRVDPTPVSLAFNEDGSYLINGLARPKWEANKNHLVLHRGGERYSFAYRFSENGTKLLLDGEAGLMSLTRQG
jgi:hypothetical protein